MIVNEAKTCRVCAGNVKQVADFGTIHINDFPAEPNKSLGSAPMILDQCVDCDLVQMRHTVDPNILYGEHYWYRSGLNPKLKQNLLDIANIVNTYTDRGDIVLDIGANDGTLLSGIKTDRIRIGCEPAPNMQFELKQHADYIIDSMWTHELMWNQNPAKVITAIGMFYDLDDPNNFINSVKESLQSDGIFIAQLMTLAPMLKMNDVGNICHEHLEYYSYKSLVNLYENNGLEIYKVIENDIQGGSYQIYARHYNKGSIDYKEDITTLFKFIETVETNGYALRELLQMYKKQGKSCYVYGASTKGNTLLQLWNIGEYFNGAAEIHTDKIGRYTVGTNIPIITEPEALDIADVLFVPNYGFKDLFSKKLSNWISRGGILVFAMPKLEVVTNENINISNT